MAFPSKLRNILLFLIFWRLTSVYVVQTSHVPDEYWQSLEVAHRLTFGYGYLTWEWRSRIRSYIYPFLISILYSILSKINLDYTVLLTNLPRIFQALLSAYADYRFYVWTRSKWALFAFSTNWFWYYCATRTLTNTVETALTTIALSIFPWPGGRCRDSKFLWIVGFLTAARPTAAILWTPLCLYHICTSREKIYDSTRSYSFIGFVTLFYSVLIDSICYKSFVVTPWEFFKTNFLHSVADFYGTHNFLWYFGQALPVILGLQIFIFPFAVFGIIKNWKSHREQVIIIGVAAWTILVYSCLPHKEFRFILPLLPLLVRVSTSCKNFPLTFRMTEYRRKILLSLVVISNLLPGLYFSLIHQRGSLDAMKFLESELSRFPTTNKSLMFLTPCHATPLYSHLHIDVPVKFLTCEPNLKNLSDYIDETDKFFDNPMIWLDTNLKKDNSSDPDLVVLFDNLSPRIMPFLKNYRLLVKIFHAHFPQPNYGQYIEVYERNVS